MIQSTGLWMDFHWTYYSYYIWNPMLFYNYQRYAPSHFSYLSLFSILIRSTTHEFPAIGIAFRSSALSSFQSQLSISFHTLTRHPITLRTTHRTDKAFPSRSLHCFCPYSFALFFQLLCLHQRLLVLAFNKPDRHFLWPRDGAFLPGGEGWEEWTGAVVTSIK